MNFYDYDEESPAIQMAPLIDIVFILLIFFVTTSAMESFEKDIAIDLPQGNVPAIGTSATQVVFVEVSRDGGVKLEGNPLQMNALKAKLTALVAVSKDINLVIRADKDVTWQRIVDVIEAASQAGIKKLDYSITDRDEGGPR
ncbi:MAG: biopolymer transporter ExbD [Candidatus Brocadiia bacterium]